MKAKACRRAPAAHRDAAGAQRPHIASVGATSSRAHAAAAGVTRCGNGDEARHHHVHLGHHRAAEGRDAQLRRTFASVDAARRCRGVTADHERAHPELPLPLAHVAERTLVEHALAGHRSCTSTSPESLETFTRPTCSAPGPRSCFSRCRSLWVRIPAGPSRAKMPPAENWQRLLALRSSAASCGSRVPDVAYSASRSASSPPAVAAPMPPELLRWYNRPQALTWSSEVYGMTEGCGVSQCHAARRAAAPCGRH